MSIRPKSKTLFNFKYFNINSIFHKNLFNFLFFKLILMKILITHELFPPDIVGGGETLTYKIAKELQKLGYDVKVITSGDPEIKIFDEIETIRIPVNRYFLNFSAPIISKHAKEVDLIHTSSGNMCFPSYIAAKNNKKPICCYIHHIFGSNWKYVRGPIIGSLFEKVEKFVLTKNYDAIIFQNSLSKKIGLSIGINESNTYMLHPGIDYKKFQIKGIKKEGYVLFVGNFLMDKGICAIKGLNYLIEAARELPSVKFIIVGGGKYLNTLKKTSPSNVNFVGPKEGRELVEIYNKASIFCLPSLAEGFGISILEAMASGCSIVSTIDIGQKGILIEPKNSKSIVNGIKYYIEKKNEAEKDGKKNRKLAKKYTWKKYIDELTKIYDYITTKK